MDRARVQSTRQWESHITQLMEESVSSSRIALTRTSWTATARRLIGSGCEACRFCGGSGNTSTPRRSSERPAQPLRSVLVGGSRSRVEENRFAVLAASPEAVEDPGVVLFEILAAHCAEISAERDPVRRGDAMRVRAKATTSRRSHVSDGDSERSDDFEAEAGGSSDGSDADEARAPVGVFSRSRASVAAEQMHALPRSQHAHHSLSSGRRCEACSSSVRRGFATLEQRLERQEASLGEVKGLLAQALLALERRAAAAPPTDEAVSPHDARAEAVAGPLRHRPPQTRSRRQSMPDALPSHDVQLLRLQAAAPEPPMTARA